MVFKGEAWAKPTIWPEYISYLRSGQTTRIPFDVAKSGWDRDAKRFATRNNRLVGIRAPRLSSWNVHQWRHAAGIPASVDKITRDLHSIDADVLCLQEYMPRTDVDEVLDSIYPYKHITMMDRNFGNAIFSRTPFVPASERVINLPVDPEVNESRVCTVVQIIDGPTIMNTHLEVRNSYPYVHKYRYPQIDKIISEASRISGPLILCGDFNAGVLSKVDHKFHDRIIESGFTRVPINRKQSVANSNIYGGFVDHIYVRNVNVSSIHTYFTNTSDHYPIITTAPVKIESLLEI